MLRSLATFPLLTGLPRRPAADLASSKALLLRVSAMVEAHHEIAELDLNPVVATQDEALIVDARFGSRARLPPSLAQGIGRIAGRSRDLQKPRFSLSSWSSCVMRSLSVPA